MSRSWLVAGLAVVLHIVSCGAAIAQDERGYGPWRLGMSKAAVRGIAEFAPYNDVPSTGGLEAPSAVFEGRRTNISFVFGEKGLQKIQIWAYEGQSRDSAIDSWYRVRQYLSRTHGAVEMPGLPIGADASREDFVAVVNKALDAQPPSRVARMQMAPVTMPQGMSVFSSLFRQPQHGYFVFLYFQEP